MSADRLLRFAPPAIVLAIATAFLGLTYQLPPAARTAPLAVGKVVLVLALLDFVTRLDTGFGRALMRILNPAALEAQRPDEAPRSARHMLSAMGLVLLLVVALILVGVLPAAALVVLIAFLSAGDMPRWVAVASALGAACVIWVIFAVLLRLPLFPGLLFGGAF